jgi:hypothetical protein
MFRTRAMANTVALAAVSIAIVSASAGTSHAAPAPAAYWQQYQVPVTGQANLVGVAAPGRDDAWAAGFLVKVTGTAAARPTSGALRPLENEACADEQNLFPSLMLHWNGQAWSQAPVPNLGRINYISATSATDVWASADCGLLHWNGQAWVTVPYAPGPGPQDQLGAIAADGAGDAWATGSTYDSATGAAQAYVERWNGSQWQVVATPGLGDSYQFDAVAARGPNDVWVTGVRYADDSQSDQLLLLHWDGHTWKRLPAPATGLPEIFDEKALVNGPDNAWLVGWGNPTPDSDDRLPVILHWNGKNWATSPAPSGPGELYDITETTGGLRTVGDTYSPDATSYGMYSLRRSGTSWLNTPVPATGAGSVFGTAAVPGGGQWVVGASGQTTSDPFIARRG